MKNLSSSKSDPGLSGCLTPFVKLYDNSFSEYEEPNFWEEQFDGLMQDYNSLVGRQQALVARRKLLKEDTQKEEVSVQCSIDTVKKLMEPVYNVECKTDISDFLIPLEKGGYILYEK